MCGKGTAVLRGNREKLVGKIYVMHLMPIADEVTVSLICGTSKQLVSSWVP